MDDNGASDRLPANRLLGVRHFDTTAITASTPGMEKVGVRTPVIAVKMNAAPGAAWVFTSELGYCFRSSSTKSSPTSRSPYQKFVRITL
jgi:hypothetical protein